GGHHRRRRPDRGRQHGHRVARPARPPPRPRAHAGGGAQDGLRPRLRPEQERGDPRHRAHPHGGRADPARREVVVRPGDRGARGRAAGERLRPAAARRAAGCGGQAAGVRPGAAAPAGRRGRRPLRAADRRGARRAAATPPAAGLPRRVGLWRDERAGRRRRRRTHRHRAPARPGTHPDRSHRRRPRGGLERPRLRRPPRRLDVGAARGRPVPGPRPGRLGCADGGRRAGGDERAARPRAAADGRLRRLGRDGLRSTDRRARRGTADSPGRLRRRGRRPRAGGAVRADDRAAVRRGAGSGGRPDAAQHAGRHPCAQQRASAPADDAPTARDDRPRSKGRVTGSL
ncbi:MAG: hypothetical protein AVDCRST_MAG07-452, partial [uncultured Frankineae bacterium]